MSTNSMSAQSNRYTTLDIVFMVLVGVVFGTLFAFTARSPTSSPPRLARGRTDCSVST